MARKYLQRLSYTEIEKASTKKLQSYYSDLRDIYKKQTERYKKSYPDMAWQFEPPEKGKVVGGPLYYYTIAERKQLPYLKGQSAEVLRRDLERATKELSQLIIQRTETGQIITDTGYNIPSIAFQKAKISERDRKTLKSLHDAGYEHISKSTLKNFGRFMDAMRTQYGKKLPNSDKIAEFFDSLKYNTKRKATYDLVSLWEEFKNNGYQPDNGNMDLFST